MHVQGLERAGSGDENGLLIHVKILDLKKIAALQYWDIPFENIEEMAGEMQKHSSLQGHQT